MHQSLNSISMFSHVRRFFFFSLQQVEEIWIIPKMQNEGNLINGITWFSWSNPWSYGDITEPGLKKKKKNIMLPFVLQNICRLCERSHDKNHRKKKKINVQIIHMKNTFCGFGKGLDGCKRSFKGRRDVKTSLTSALLELNFPGWRDSLFLTASLSVGSRR